MTDDDPSERATQPNGIVSSAASGGRWKEYVDPDTGEYLYRWRAEPEKAAEHRSDVFAMRIRFLEKKIEKHAEETTAFERRELEAYRERDKWRERFMVLRSRLHGIRDSLMKLDRELGRIIDEK